MTENVETFFKRIEPTTAESDLIDIELAYVLAKHGHRHQFRKELDMVTGEPVRYFEHVRRSALILIDLVKCIEPPMIMAMILHDTIEDTRRITAELIEHFLGREVARLVKMLSKVPKEGYLERLMSYGDWRVLVLKACDRLDNLRSLGCGTPEFQRKQIKETKEKYAPVFALMIELTPPQYKKGVRQLDREIKKIVRDYGDRFRKEDRKSEASSDAENRGRPPIND